MLIFMFKSMNYGYNIGYLLLRSFHIISLNIGIFMWCITSWWPYRVGILSVLQINKNYQGLTFGKYIIATNNNIAHLY